MDRRSLGLAAIVGRGRGRSPASSGLRYQAESVSSARARARSGIERHRRPDQAPISRGKRLGSRAGASPPRGARAASQPRARRSGAPPRRAPREGDGQDPGELPRARRNRDRSPCRAAGGRRSAAAAPRQQEQEPDTGEKHHPAFEEMQEALGLSRPEPVDRSPIAAIRSAFIRIASGTAASSSASRSSSGPR